MRASVKSVDLVATLHTHLEAHLWNRDARIEFMKKYFYTSIRHYSSFNGAGLESGGGEGRGKREGGREERRGCVRLRREDIGRKEVKEMEELYMAKGEKILLKRQRKEEEEKEEREWLWAGRGRGKGVRGVGGKKPDGKKGESQIRRREGSKNMRKRKGETGQDD